ncbi:MAG: M23 family metallopeptidase [Gemmatimonadales bacterium]|nr:MAG: M23 family metallopeptidase [Gemmatimonadales bacterium]
MPDDRGLTILIIPENGEASRTFRLSGRGVRRLLRGGVVVGVLLLVLGGSWVYFAWEARKTAALRAEVSALEVDRERLGELASTLVEVERAYAQVLALFTEGAGAPLAGASAPRAGAPGDRSGVGDGSLPDTWPLADRGFVTQGLSAGLEGPIHPGVDVAVPEGTYVRAAASGRVVEASDDPIYGLFLILEHGDGYRTLYAHAAELLARVGDQVESGEIIALSGSTGRSSAPHLHFEVLRDGQPVDPLEYVTQP